MVDWRLPENRREAFLRFYGFHLKYQSHPGCVYALLPYIAEEYDLDEKQRAWLVWLNGNTQNVVTSLLLLEASEFNPYYWEKAVAFYNRNFKLLEWDTDRRHQKSKFGEATARWYEEHPEPHNGWLWAGFEGWDDVWRYAFKQPYMGRLSAWSMIEYARILLPGIPDAGTWLLDDRSGSRSHRNGIAVVAGYDAAYWGPDDAHMLGVVGELEHYADGLLTEARSRWLTASDTQEADVCRLTMESALCTYKSWHKPNRRYPNVYADMMYYRIKRAEARFERSLDVLWEAREAHLPEYLRLEDNPYDPGLDPVKQNHYLNTGQIPVMYRDWPELGPSDFDLTVELGGYGLRKDPKWTS